MEILRQKEEAKRLQGARKLRKDEEMAWAPPRNVSKWPDWEEARNMEESGWRLEPEGEAEVPEIIIVSDAGKHSWTWMAKAVVSREKQNSPGERERSTRRRESGEMKSPRRKVIRVELEETQDYVRGAKSTEQEEMEERIFVPSAASVPQKPLFRCGNECSEKTLSYWQLASVVAN